MDLPILNISYKWNYTVCGLLCLVSFTCLNVFEVHPQCGIYQYFIHFLWLNNVLFYGYTTFCLSTHLLLDILYILNSAAMNICVHLFVWVPVLNSFWYIPRNEIARSYGNSMFNFLRNDQNIFYSGRTISHSHQQSTRVPISSHLCQNLFFDDGHSDRCEVIPHCSFDLHFSNN